MKTYFFSTFILLILFINVKTSFSQKADKLITHQSVFNEASITSIKGNFVAECSYLKWTVKNLKTDELFIVLRSIDDKAFEVVGFVPAVGVPISDDILYCFKDESPKGKKLQYRVSIVSGDFELHSAVVVLNPDKRSEELHKAQMPIILRTFN